MTEVPASGNSAPKSKPITILAIDPAQSCGYAVAKITGDVCEITEYGYIDVDNSSLYLGDWCLDLIRRLDILEERICPDEIAVEDYFFSGKFANGSNVNPSYRAAIYMWARRNSTHYEILNISSWKIFVSGRTTPTKEQKIKWGKEAAKKLMTVQSLWERWKIRLPNHSISEHTKKPIAFRFDVADAIGQAMYAAYLRYNCKAFTCAVPVPADVVFKKPSKKTFSYN
jgi:Holliday junction resolvasome RuvABC endonuclease subunit